MARVTILQIVILLTAAFGFGRLGAYYWDQPCGWVEYRGDNGELIKNWYSDWARCEANYDLLVAIVRDFSGDTSQVEQQRDEKASELLALKVKTITPILLSVAAFLLAAFLLAQVVYKSSSSLDPQITSTPGTDSGSDGT